MPNPSTALSTLRPDLGESFEEFDLLMDRRGFIAHRVLPSIEVSVQSGEFGRIPLEQLLRNKETLRTSKAGYNRGDWEFQPETFSTREYGWEEPIDNRDEKIYQNYFSAEQISAELALDSVMRSAERRAASIVFDAATWTGANLTTAVDNGWNDNADGTPIDDVKEAKFKVFDNSGLWPNALVIDQKVAMNLRRNDQVLEVIASFGAGDSISPGKISIAQLALALDIEEIIVAGGAQNLAHEGQSRDIATLWGGEYAMVCRVARTQSIKEPCIGRTFHWGVDGSSIGGAFETYRDENVRADIVRCRHEVQEKILYKEAGHLLSGITDSE